MLSKKQLILRIYYNDAFYGKRCFFFCVSSIQVLAVKSVLFEEKTFAPSLPNTVMNCKYSIFRAVAYCLETNLVILKEQYTLHILKAGSFKDLQGILVRNIMN